MKTFEEEVIIHPYLFTSIDSLKTIFEFKKNNTTLFLNLFFY